MTFGRLCGVVAHTVGGASDEGPVRSAWSRYAAAGTAVAPLAALMPPGTARTVTFALVGIGSALAVLAGARLHGVADREGWSLVALAVAAWAGGDVVYLMHGRAPGASFSLLPADLLYGSAYLALIAALCCFARRQRLTDRRGTMVDAALVTASLAVVVWVLAVEPRLGLGHPSTELALRAAYPMGDVLVLGLVLWVARPSGRSGSARWGLLAGVGLVQVSGLVSAAGLGWNSAAEPVLMAGWLIGYTLVGVAALHPTMTSLTEPDLRPDPHPGSPQLVRIGIAVATAPALMAVQLSLGRPVSVAVALVAAPLTLTLALIRLVLLLRRLDEQTRLLGGAAETDVVTGLPNRRGLLRTLSAWFAYREDDDARALICILVLRQAELAARVGVEADDELWDALARRVSHLAGCEALVTRPAEGELAVLVPVPGEGTDALVDCLYRGVRDPLALAGLEVRLDVGVGVLMLPQDARDAATAVHLAQAAAHAAVDVPGHVARYAPDLVPDPEAGHGVVDEVRAALGAGHLVVHYQPQLDLATGQVSGVEALVRWRHPQRGLLAPGVFLPAVERTALIGPVTAFVLDEALRQAAHWRDEGLALTVAVNLSARNLLDPRLVELVRARLAEHDLAPAALELEVTESMAMLDPRSCLHALGELSALGVRLTVDDYGTGYSSLAYLQRMPLHRLKIDRSLVMGLVQDEASAVIVRSTLELSRNLGLEVVAEGVEDEPTLVALARLRCGYVQGFGVGRPVPAEEIPRLIRAIHADRVLPMRHRNRVSAVPTQPWAPVVRPVALP